MKLFWIIICSHTYILSYIYLYLTPNHLFYGRAIQSFIQSSPLTNDPSELTTYSNQVTTVINRFGEKWRYEYLVNLRETHKFYCTNKNHEVHTIKRCSISTFRQNAKVYMWCGYQWFNYQWLSVCDLVQSLFGICMVVRTHANTNAFFYIPVVFIRLHEVSMAFEQVYQISNVWMPFKWVNTSNLMTFECCFLIL